MRKLSLAEMDQLFGEFTSYPRGVLPKLPESPERDYIVLFSSLFWSSRYFLNL